MPDVDVAVVGAGAAGIAAARRVAAAGRTVVVLEARGRLGGRAWTLIERGEALDLGCGWLHSAEQNDWAQVAVELGFAIDRTPPPWGRSSRVVGMTEPERTTFYAAWDAFDDRLDEAATAGGDRAAADFLDPACRWNPLIDALSTFINGVELAALSVQDFCRYRDTRVNWRIERGYGTLIAAFGQPLDVRTGCPVSRIVHSGPHPRVHTAQGEIEAAAVIVTVPTNIIARERIRFDPALPDKVAAAADLPLGLADKVFLAVDEPDDLPVQTRLFGSTERTATASYHLRPHGSATIEGYFGGALARDLEAGGDAAFAAFAIDELAAFFGNDIRRRLTLLAASGWGRDPHALGSYSYARIGRSDARAVLAAPVDGRLFFAGEACSRHDFSTAHGAYRSGVAAADAVLGELQKGTTTSGR